MVVPSRRLLAGVLVASSALLATSALALPSASAATNPLPIGLFGTADPTYDGVFRQSLGLLAYAAAGETPPTAALDWLLGQQCADGGFQSFRADPSAACTASDPVNFTGEDTNSTGLAAAALVALGRTSEAQDAIGWLRAAQASNGGFPYFVGGDPDVNSTGISLLATNSVGVAPNQVTRAGSPSAAAWLATQQLGCTAPAGSDGGFEVSWAPGEANVLATLQGTLGLSGAALPFADGPVATDVPTACPTPNGSWSPAELAGGFLSRYVGAHDHAVPKIDFSTGQPIAGSVDVSGTAWAVLDLSATAVGKAERDAALAVLLAQVGTSAPSATTTTFHASKKLRTAVAPTSTEDPGMLGLVALAASSSGASGARVSGLVARLGATIVAAPASPSPTPSVSVSASGTPAAELSPTGASPLTPAITLVGLLLLALGGGAVVVSRRAGAWS